MFRPPDFLWICQKCGNQIGGFSEGAIDLASFAPMKCPEPKCDGYMKKEFFKSNDPEENPFKKY